MTEPNKQPPDNSNQTSDTTEPRAMIHKQVLDVAATYPEGSVEKLAEEVTGATPDLVEKVLEKYGDPGETGEQEATTDSGITAALGNDIDDPSSVTDSSSAEVTDSKDDSATSVDSETEREDDEDQEATQDSSKELDTKSQIELNPDLTLPDLNSLTEIQEETLRAIHEKPSATQAELADQFDVTSASISQRVNSIDDFQWTKRQRITEALFVPINEKNNQSNKVAASDGGTETVSESTSTDKDTSTEGRAESSTNSDINPENNDTKTSDAAAACNCSEELERQEERLGRLEQRIADQPTPKPEYGRIDPALIHKVVHACIESEQISESEELEIIQQLVGPEED